MTEPYQLPLDVEGLLAKAREMTAINIIDTEAVEPLTVLVKSLNQDSHLHKKGVIAKQNKLLRLLCNRLRMQRDFAAHPDIADEKIIAPVFILGMARSGTTKTHRMLAASGDFNYLPFWQTQYPALLTGDKNESPQARIDAADDYCNWLNAVSPNTKACHSFETFAAEEDSLLTEQCLIAPSFLGYSEVPSYIAWFGEQGMVPVFTLLRDVLKYLQWQGLASAEKPWLLKAPTYYGFEPALLSVFADAHIIMAHRSPLNTVPSLCKLLNLFHEPFGSAKVEPQSLCKDLAMTLDLHLSNRKNYPTLNIVDIHFKALVASVETVAKRVYQHAGLHLSPHALNNILEWDANNRIHQKGRFDYSLEEFGLSAEYIQRDMAAYIAFVDGLVIN